MRAEKVNCTECGVEILATTSAKTGGKCVPCDRGTRAQIEESKKRTAEERRLREVNDQARERILRKPHPELEDFLAEEDPLGVLWPVVLDTVFPRPERRERIDALSHAARVIYLVQSVAGEVYNGGFHQFFSNSSGEHAEESHRALLEVGAVEAAGLLERAIRAFADSRVPADRLERNKELDAADNRQPGLFDDLDREFYSLEAEGPVVEDLGKLLLGFMRRHATSTVAAA